MSVAAERVSSPDEEPVDVQPVIAVIDLEPRPQDKVLNPEEFEIIEFFDKLDKLPPLGRYPGAVVLRKFEAGDVVCRQGERGHSAFYVLTDNDIDRLHELDEEIGPAVPLDPSLNGRMGSIYILPGQSVAKAAPAWQFWKRNRKATRTAPAPTSIPNDFVEDIDPETRHVDLKQGETVGEMSCMSFRPRSATIIVEHDCWLLELNRNIFDGLQRDKGYRKHVDQLYAERTLDGQLKNFKLFSGLTAAQHEELRQAATFELLEPGSIICEEGDVEPDPDVFVIRSGVVQVVKNAVVSMKAYEISDWRGFCKALVGAATSPPAAPAAAPGTPASTAARPGKPSPAEIKAQALRKAAEKSAAPATAPAGGDTPQPSAKPTPAEILARAKQVKEAKANPPAGATDKPAAPEPAAQKPGKPSTAEIIAAARRKSAPGDAAPPAAEVASAPAAAEPAAAAHAPVGKPSTADIIAAARAKSRAGAGAEPPKAADATAATPEPAADPAPPPKARPSTAEIIAAQRQKKAAAAAPAKNEAAASASAPAAAPRAKLTAAEMLAAVQKKRAAGQVDDETPETALRTSIAKEIDRPKSAVFAWLSDKVQDAVRTIAEGPNDPPEALVKVVLGALNELLRWRPFVMSPQAAYLLDHHSLRWRVQSCPKGVKGIKDAWSDIDVRQVGRTMLSLIFPEFIVSPGEKSGPPRTLAYRTRNDVIGEMALVLNAPRSATCIAYDHPPDPKGKRASSRLELVRIKGAVFRKLMADDPALDAYVRSLARSRVASDVATDVVVDDQAPLASSEFHDLGLYQGQKLLVIDLDSCTRCGDCMRACVETHDDGRSRLFLDGPRFDRFLIPSACRQCLNPLCMIDCPVGSIERGENDQMEIRDWCIGCGKCAEQCPYDSIQMHDIGIVADVEAGWQFAPLGRVREGWQNSRSARSRWGSGLSPFAWTAEFRNAVAALDPQGGWTTSSTKLPEPVCFRLTFHAGPEQLNDNREFRLLVTAPNLHVETLTSADPAAEPKQRWGIWLNGRQRADVYRDEKMQRAGQFGVKLKRDELRARGNVLAVRIDAEGPLAYGAHMLSARLDAIPEAGIMVLEGIGEGKTPEIKLVTENAVVCDLCSHIPGQEPACVSQCPHDAAMRINPLTEFGRIWNR